MPWPRQPSWYRHGRPRAVGLTHRLGRLVLEAHLGRATCMPCHGSLPLDSLYCFLPTPFSGSLGATFE